MSNVLKYCIIILLFVCVVGIGVLGYVVYQDKKERKQRDLDAKKKSNLAQYAQTEFVLPRIPPAEIVSSLIDLTGTAELGAKWGLNIVNGKTFYVDSNQQRQQSLIGSPSLNIAKTVQYQPPMIGSNLTSTDEIVVTGLLAGLHYDIEIDTNISAYPTHEIKYNVFQDGKLTVEISNKSGYELALPLLTISILRLN